MVIWAVLTRAIFAYRLPRVETSWVNTLMSIFRIGNFLVLTIDAAIIHGGSMSLVTNQVSALLVAFGRVSFLSWRAHYAFFILIYKLSHFALITFAFWGFLRILKPSCLAIFTGGVVPHSLIILAHLLFTAHDVSNGPQMEFITHLAWAIFSHSFARIWASWIYAGLLVFVTYMISRTLNAGASGYISHHTIPLTLLFLTRFDIFFILPMERWTFFALVRVGLVEFMALALSVALRFLFEVSVVAGVTFRSVNWTHWAAS